MDCGRMLGRYSGLIGIAVVLATASPAYATLDPAQATQRDEASRQGLTNANRTITGRTQTTVKNKILGDVFSSDTGAVKSAGANGRDVTVSIGTDQEFPDLLDASGMWANISHNVVEDDVVDFKADTYIRSAIIGYDKFFMDNLLVGVALGRTHSHTDSVSRFVGAINTGDNQAQTSLYSLYGAYIVNDNVFIDGTIGIGDEETDVKSLNPATNAPVAQNSTEGLTRFASIGVTGVMTVDDLWGITGNANLFRSITEYDAVTDLVTATTTGEQQSDVTLLSLGVQVTRSFENGAFRPYVGMAFEHNFQDQIVGLSLGDAGASGVNNQTNDKTQLLLTLGMDFFPADQVTVSMEGQRWALRTGQVAYGGFFNFRYDF